MRDGFTSTIRYSWRVDSQMYLARVCVSIDASAAWRGEDI